MIVDEFRVLLHVSCASVWRVRARVLRAIGKRGGGRSVYCAGRNCRQRKHAAALFVVAQPHYRCLQHTIPRQPPQAPLLFYPPPAREQHGDWHSFTIASRFGGPK